MNKFKTTLKTEQVGRNEFVLLSDLVYVNEEGTVKVPSGFITNYASIKSLHNIFLFSLFALVSGYGNYAATLHDYLYTQASLSRKQCDDIFYEALRDEGIAKWRAWLFWTGVRLGGEKHYGVK